MEQNKTEELVLVWFLCAILSVCDVLLIFLMVSDADFILFVSFYVTFCFVRQLELCFLLLRSDMCDPDLVPLFFWNERTTHSALFRMIVLI